MSDSGAGSSIPSGVRNMVQNIKEIAGNHSEDEIYAMLKECSMDPNDTAQKLLLQDTFHEVKRKKDRRKENPNNRESGESRWKPGTHGRVRGGGGRASFSSHHVSHDAIGSKNSDSGKDNGANQVTEKSAPSLPAPQETKSKEKSSEANSAPVIGNGPTSVASGTSSVNPSSTSGGSEGTGASFGGKNSLGSNLPSGTSNKDQVLVPPNDLQSSGPVGAIRHEARNQHPPNDNKATAGIVLSNNCTPASETVGSFMQGKILGKSTVVAKNYLSESAASSTTAIHGNTSNSRPSSNYSNRSQQLLGSQKAGSNKEWKPKPTNTINQGSGPAGSSEATPLLAEETGKLQSAPCVLDSEDTSSKLQRKLENLCLPQSHVILPNHIFVPDSEKSKFSFGSLGMTFGVHTSHASTPDSDKSSTPLSETSQAIEETTDEHSLSQKAAVTSEVGDYTDDPQSPTNAPESLLSSEVEVSSSAIQEYNESKQDAPLPYGGHQHSAMQTSPNYSFGFVPPMLGTQLPPIDNSESQALDISQLPSLVVHQPFDPASYYTPFYRPGADGDGRLSPFQSSGVSAKHGGNVMVLPAPNSQSQEGGVLSTAGPASLVTQAAGLMQSSIPVTQQPVPVFRQPSGVHIPHYPPNYIPYGHYYPPFYVSPPPMHQFLGNGAFPAQPQASPVYPPPPAAAAAGMKYPLPQQYKPGANATNPAHIVVPSAYGAYGSSPVGYNPSSTSTAGNSNSNEDLGPSQLKESNVYISGQQSEGSALWLTAPGREMSSLPTSSFYSLPPQGPHMTFAPSQAGHGTFAGVYHPAQAVTAATVHPLLQQSQTMAGAVDMVGPGGGVYQQPQHSQMNWPGNY